MVTADQKVETPSAKQRQDRVRADTPGGWRKRIGKPTRDGVAASTISWRCLALGVSWRLGVFALLLPGLHAMILTPGDEVTSRQQPTPNEPYFIFWLFGDRRSDQ
jgi:hypothetical protein